MTQAISKFIFHTILGWKIVGNFHPKIKKYVLIGAPHTSWKDFYIALLSRSIEKANINLIAKKSLFKFPFGFFLRAMGALPVDRSKSNNLVEAIVNLYNSNETFRLAISPEGTRKRVESWKTGFYYIAKGANVPIVMYGFDFGNKQVKISEPFYPTDDMNADFKSFLNFYKDIVGANPESFNNDSFLNISDTLNTGLK